METKQDEKFDSEEEGDLDNKNSFIQDPPLKEKVDWDNIISTMNSMQESIDNEFFRHSFLPSTLLEQDLEDEDIEDFLKIRDI